MAEGTSWCVKTCVRLDPGALSNWTLFDACKLLSGLRYRLYSLLCGSYIGVHNGVWPLAFGWLFDLVSMV